MSDKLCGNCAIALKPQDDWYNVDGEPWCDDCYSSMDSEPTRAQIKILTVAIRQHGLIYSLPRPNRHHEIMLAMTKEQLTQDYQQGFLTSEGEFVDRSTAYVIAKKAGQFLPHGEQCPPDLYSEDLW